MVPFSIGNPERGGWWNVAAAFTWHLWVLVAGMTGVTVLAMLLVTRASLWSLRPEGRGSRPAEEAATAGLTLLGVAAALVNQPLVKPPRRSPGRVLIGSWLLAGMIVAAAYQVWRHSRQSAACGRQDRPCA